MLFFVGGLVGMVFIYFILSDIYHAENYDYDDQHRLDKYGGNT